MTHACPEQGVFLKERRHEDVTPEIKALILQYTAEALSGKTYPIGQFYPDVVASRTK